MQPILVTGFEPFGAHRTNPSEQVVRALAARPGLVGAVLPVSYRRAEARLGALLEATQPCALLLLGLAAGSVIRLERVARNLDQAEACDEDGELRCGRAVSERGPPEHASTLPLEGFAAALMIMKKTIWLPIVISLVFAFLMWQILIAGFNLPIPGLDAYVGVSEIFNLIAAILGGPITAVIGNILFGIFGYTLIVCNTHPWPTSFYLTLADVVAHIISLVLVTFCYRSFYEPAKRYKHAQRNVIVIAGWVLISISFYFVLIPLQVTFINLVNPGTLTFSDLFRGTLPEILVTTFITVRRSQRD